MSSVIEPVANRRPPGLGRIVVYQSGRRTVLSLDAFDALARRTAVHLLDCGVRAGDRVGIVAKNGLEWALLDIAALKIKAVTAGFEVDKVVVDADLIKRFGLRLVFADKPSAHERARPIQALLPSLEGLPTDPDLPPVAYAPDDVTTIKFTSGSTGRPKGLAARAGSIDCSITAVQTLFGHCPGDALLVFLPLSLLQQRYWIYSALVFGHDIVVSASEFAFHALKREAPTVVMGVPAFFDTLCKAIAARVESDDSGALRAQAREVVGDRIRYLWTGSAPANPDTLAFLDRCGLKIFEGYGLNETCIVAKNAPGAHRVGSVGRPVSGKHVAIDPEGVIVVRSDEPVNASYLFCEPGESERIFRLDGSVRTGDLGRFDADGFLYVLGRADDVVVLANGRNVMVRPVEERLRSCPAVADCIVAGSGLDRLAAIVCPNQQADAREVIGRHVAMLNKAAASDERIGGLVLANEPFSVENGLLTSQFKPRRKAILARYRDELAETAGGV